MILDNTYVRITNNFLHDMATGTWAACLLVLWSLNRQLASLSSEAQGALANSMQLVFWLLIVALVVLTITGALRLFYWRGTTPAEERTAKQRALVVKHIAFLVIYGGGTYWAWLLTS